MSSSMSNAQVLALVLALWLLGAAPEFARVADALRGGAPTLACYNNMRPYHGLHRPKPASASQFFLRQSSLTYSPGQNITVEILTHSSERNFRGFMVQAYDPVNGLRIGKFIKNEHSQPMPCSSATHHNHQDKHSALLTWVQSQETGERSRVADSDSPSSIKGLGSWLGLPVAGGGDESSNSARKRRAVSESSSSSPLRQVRFRGTIVVSYSEFYTGFESSELNFAKWDYSASSVH